MRILRYIFFFLALIVATSIVAQDKKDQNLYKVKKGETLYGIATQNGITVDELIQANPEMSSPDFKLKKGVYITIPKATPKVQEKVPALKGQTLKVGIVLPLHDDDGDGRRMAEYYRGILMACDDLKKDGISIEINTYNTPQDCQIDSILEKSALKDRNIIFGPLYTKQLSSLTSYARASGSKIVIPFSINGNDVATNSNIFQIHKSPTLFNENVVKQFIARFKDSNVIIVDCQDATSDKGAFTSSLRKKIEENGMSNKITSIISPYESFKQAFSETSPNVVVLNTGRSPELNKVIARLDSIQIDKPSLEITLFGYTEWLMYEKHNKAKFFKYDTYVPTNAYYNPYSSKVKALEEKYQKWFKSDMMEYLPRFALTGYDHGMFFLKGLYEDGMPFTGSQQDKDFVQTPLRFTRVSSIGGYQNMAFLFVHYNRNNTISLINF